jgi:hypothetical protein
MTGERATQNMGSQSKRLLGLLLRRPGYKHGYKPILIRSQATPGASRTSKRIPMLVPSSTPFTCCAVLDYELALKLL